MAELSACVLVQGDILKELRIFLQGGKDDESCRKDQMVLEAQRRCEQYHQGCKELHGGRLPCNQLDSVFHAGQSYMADCRL